MWYAEATKIGEKDLVVSHPIHWDRALNFSEFPYEIIPDQDESRKMVRDVGKIVHVPVVMRRQVPTSQNCAENGGSANRCTC